MWLLPLLQSARASTTKWVVTSRSTPGDDDGYRTQTMALGRHGEREFFLIYFIHPLFNQEGPIEIQNLFFQGVLVKMSGMICRQDKKLTHKLTQTHNN